jgi:hypothetical protein
MTVLLHLLCILRPHSLHLVDIWQAPAREIHVSHIKFHNGLTTLSDIRITGKRERIIEVGLQRGGSGDATERQCNNSVTTVWQQCNSSVTTV